MKEFTRLYSTFCIIITIQWAGNIYIHKVFFSYFIVKTFLQSNGTIDTGIYKVVLCKKSLLACSGHLSMALGKLKLQDREESFVVQ